MKRVLITGATRGLGEGLAVSYAEPGATIGLVGRDTEAMKQVAERVESRGARTLRFLVDVTDTSRMQEIVREFGDAAGGIDIAIANAGIGEGRRDSRCDPHEAARVIEVNVIGLTNTLLPCVEIMKKQGFGTLVGMASVAGYRAIPGSLAYSASKAAVMTLMEGLEMELDGSGIHTVTLCPGFVRTALTDRNEFKMPFRIERDDACTRMKRAIDSGESRYTFPLPMAFAAQIMRIAPQWLLKQSSPRWRNRKKPA